MNIIKATKRTTASAGQIKKIRSEGLIPAVLYGGKKDNLNISLKKIHLKEIVRNETFMSKVFDLEIDGSPEKVLPRDVAYDPVSDEPIHIDFLRIVKGTTIVINIPVKFINHEKSPGLKKGGVLNIVRRKVELKCPAENIPNEIIVDLDNTEINSSLKISSVKLPENIVPTITDRDFVIATVVSPTILVEPEKTDETAVEGEVAADGTAEEGTEAAGKTEDSKDKSAKASDDKAKPADDKTKSTAADKGKPSSKEPKKK
tara:strand:- start:138 stop:914 length:777 start_codon:yes stop_codon:yes gene_type:complete